ncbi:MAG: SIS domain-containing protein [Hyphomicrobiales bacterium]|jgi:6-phospho-3-hexuloisomerase|nr:SIS domain-containing protein [Hyphomicrobiales bacterium]
MSSLYRTALSELGGVFDKLDAASVDTALGMIANAKKTVVFGGGRERLQIMGFAMRLYHMGLNVAVEGDMTTPPVGKGDLFIVTVGPGEISTALALLGVAKKAGAAILVLTAQPKGRAAAFADFVLTIPAQTMADDQGTAKSSVLPMGSLYEGALFILFEVMVLKLRDMLKVDPEVMRGNHTNLE